MSAELIRNLKILIAVPGALALVWVMYQALVVQRRASAEAAQEWPAIAAELGFEFFVPEASTSGSTLVAGMRGEHRGRQVTIVTGTYLSGGSSERTVTGTTRWTTASPPDTPTVFRKAVADRVFPDRGALTGDDLFDREYTVQGDAAQVTRALTPTARDAIRAYGDNFGAFSLGSQGLEHPEDAITVDADRIRGVLNWQAFVLDALASDRASPLPEPVARKSILMPWVIVMAVLLISCAGMVLLDRRARAEAKAKEEAAAATGPVLPKVGDRVAANYRGKGRWYVGVVVERVEETGTARVVYQDGESEFLPSTHLAPDPLGAGSSGMLLTQGNTIVVEVTRRVGDAVLVTLGEGPPEWRSARMLGLNPVTAQGEQRTRETAPQVWAVWDAADPWLYPAEVVETEGARVRLVFRDGESGWRTTEQVRRDLPPPVEVQVLQGETWTQATVRRRVEHALLVEVEGQAEAWTALGKVRRASP